MDSIKSIDNFSSAISKLSFNLHKIISEIPQTIKSQAQEVRLRINKPVAIYCANKMYYITTDKRAVTTIYNGKMLLCSEADIKETFENICEYSVYSYQNEIANGYITIKGGHRVGICGTAVYKKDKIENVKDISSINIRVSRQIIGSADELIKRVGVNSNGLLLCGCPSCGKTTVLRDLARQLSNRYSKKIAVIDERCEIGSIHMGVSQNDLGQSDILDGYKKGEGILQAVRCMSPDVIICDEVGTTVDIEAIEQGLNAGVSIVASIHATNAHELMQKPQGRALIKTGAFEKIVFFKGREQVGEIKEVITVKELLNDTYSRSDNFSSRSNFYKLNNFSKAN